MTIFCPKCGAANEDFVEFCASCGESMAEVREKKGQAIQPEVKETSSMKKKLYRSRTNKWVSGLSAGLAKYFDMDVDLVRILWIVIIFFSGTSLVIVYFILWIVTPLEPKESQGTDQEAKESVSK